MPRAQVKGLAATKLTTSSGATRTEAMFPPGLSKEVIPNGLIGWTAQHTSSTALASNVTVIASDEAITPAADQCGAEVGRLRVGFRLVQAAARW